MPDSIEVSVMWRDRILSVFGFRRAGAVSIGSDGRADVLVPGLPAGIFDLVEIGTVTKLRLAQGMRAEVGSGGTFNKVDSSLREVFLLKHQTARVQLPGELLSLTVRHAPSTPSASGLPLIGLQADEWAGVLLALALSLMLSLFTGLRLPGAMVLEPRVEPKITRAKFLIDPELKVLDLSEIQYGPTGPSKMFSRKQNPRSTPKTAQGDLLSTFASKGLSEVLNKNLGQGNELTRIVGASTGRGGDSRLRQNADLKVTNGGAGAESIPIAGDGPGNIRGGNAPGYSQVGGLGTRGRAEIQVNGSEAGFSGGMDKESIRRVIREHLPEIRNCYERELQARPDLHGKLVLQWDIEAGGRVSRASVKSDSLQTNKVADCLVAQLRSWKFPEPPVNQTGRISFPFIFSSQ